MAEDTPASSVPTAETGEPPVERAPDAESKPTTVDSAPAPTTTTEQPAEKANGSKDKASGKLAVQFILPLSPVLSRLQSASYSCRLLTSLMYTRARERARRKERARRGPD